jgi:predicted amidohydrolase YtcJ
MLADGRRRATTHAVGDAAIDQVLDAYEAADAEHPIAGKRWAIEHLFVSRRVQLARMKKLDLILSVQDHLYLAAPALKNYLGAARASQITPVMPPTTQRTVRAGHRLDDHSCSTGPRPLQRGSFVRRRPPY